MQTLADLKSEARLRYWLGPWAPRSERPDAVTVRAVAGLPAGSRLYTPSDRAPRGAYVLSPGLHYDGPNDPRMDRLSRILAAAGHVVLSPASPDLMRLQLTPSAIDDLARAVAAILDAPELPAGCRPALFSVSVGSLAALRVAAMPRFAGSIAHVVVFGGYGDHVALIRSLCVDPRDPLNTPAALLTLLDRIPGAPAGDDAQILRDAWRCMIRATWPRADFKVPGGTKHHAIARAIAQDLPSSVRPLFLIGCGVDPGAWQLCEAALVSVGEPFAYMDPRPHLAGLACPVTIVHGVADDVIPFAQASVIDGALPDGVKRTVLPTGLFAHSNTIELPRFTDRAVAIARELHTFHRICRALQARS